MKDIEEITVSLLYWFDEPVEFHFFRTICWMAAAQRIRGILCNFALFLSPSWIYDWNVHHFCMQKLKTKRKKHRICLGIECCILDLFTDKWTEFVKSIHHVHNPYRAGMQVQAKIIRTSIFVEEIIGRLFIAVVWVQIKFIKFCCS